MVSLSGAVIFVLLGNQGLFVNCFSHTQQRATVLKSSATAINTSLNSGIWHGIHHKNTVLALRGGQEPEATETTSTDNDDNNRLTRHALQMPALTTATAAIVSFGNMYVRALETCPILTKSLTAGLVFFLSDFLAQSIELRGAEKQLQLQKMDKDNRKAKSRVWKRTVWASLVGFIYFGPAAHYWYDAVFRFLPGTGIISTLQKAALGQLIFGPSFTCIFFATTLMQGGQFTIGNWFQKIKQDLFQAWIAGVGFWPLVDLVSFSLVPMNLIPLFVNFCALVWNVYLSIVANAKGATESNVGAN